MGLLWSNKFPEFRRKGIRLLRYASLESTDSGQWARNLSCPRSCRGITGGGRDGVDLCRPQIACTAISRFPRPWFGLVLIVRPPLSAISEVSAFLLVAVATSAAATSILRSPIPNFACTVLYESSLAGTGFSASKICETSVPLSYADKRRLLSGMAPLRMCSPLLSGGVPPQRQ